MAPEQTDGPERSDSPKIIGVARSNGQLTIDAIKNQVSVK
jgi:hypothetical protein